MSKHHPLADIDDVIEYLDNENYSSMSDVLYVEKAVEALRHISARMKSKPQIE
jgi:hypothetical protein